MSYSYPKPVFHHDDLKAWFTKEVPTLKKVDRLNKEVSARFDILLTVKEGIEKQIVPKMLKAIKSWPENVLFPDSQYGELAVKFTEELYSILAALQDSFDYLWTGNRICLKKGITDSLYSKDMTFKMGSSSSDNDRNMTYVSLAAVQAMVQALLRRMKGSKSGDDKKMLKTIDKGIEEKTQRYYEWFHHPNRDRTFYSHFCMAQIQHVLMAISKKFSNISVNQYFKFACEGNTSIRFFGGDTLGHYKYEMLTNSRPERRSILRCRYPRNLITYSDICIIDASFNGGGSIPVRDIMFSIETLLESIEQNERETNALVGTKRSLSQIESMGSTKKRAYEHYYNKIELKGEDRVVGDSMDVDEEQEDYVESDSRDAVPSTESSIKKSTAAIAQQSSMQECSYHAKADVGEKQEDSRDAVPSTTTEESSSTTTQSIETLYRKVPNSKTGVVVKFEALSEFGEQIKAAALEIISAKNKIEKAAGRFVEFLIEKLRSSNSTASTFNKAGGIFNILRILYEEVRDQLLAELEKKYSGDTGERIMQYKTTLRNRNNQDGDPYSNERVAPKEERAKIYRTLGGIFVDIGNFMWNAIHYPLMAVGDAPLLKLVEDETFSNLDPSQTKATLSPFVSSEEFEDMSLLSLMLLKSKQTGSKKVHYNGVFNGILDTKEEVRGRAYHTDLLLAASVLTERNKKPTTKKLNDFSKSLSQARASTSTASDGWQKNFFQDVVVAPPLTGMSIEEAINNHLVTGIIDNGGKKCVLTCKSRKASTKPDALPVILMSFAKEFLSKTITSKNDDQFLATIANILKSHGLFSWELAYSNELLDETPSNGFCFYLLHTQVSMYLEQNDRDSFPKIDGNYVYGDVFRQQLFKEIEFLNESYQQTKYKEDTKKLLDLLLLILEFVSDEKNREEQKPLTNSLWGSDFLLGSLFLMQKEEPFCFYNKSKDAKNPEFMRLWNVSGRGPGHNPFPENGYFRYEELLEIINFCESTKYAGCFNGSGAHFHPVCIDHSGMEKNMQKAFSHCCKLVASTLKHIICNEHRYVSKTVDIQSRDTRRDVMDLIESDEEELEVAREKSMNISEELFTSLNNVRRCFQRYKQSETYEDSLRGLDSNNQLLFHLIKSIEQMESVCPISIVSSETSVRNLAGDDHTCNALASSNDEEGYNSLTDDHEAEESEDF